LRVMAEYRSSGVWVAEQVGLFRHGMVRHSTLSLPDDLAAQFDDWITWYWQRRNDKFDTASFNAKGLELARALKRHVGPETEVVFAPESEDGGLLPEHLVEAEPHLRPALNTNETPGSG